VKVLRDDDAKQPMGAYVNIGRETS
jgi:hypothetical protein